MYERPGKAVRIPAATKAVQHGAPCTEHNLVGVAVKTQARKWSDGFDATTTPQIAVGEGFNLRTKGIVQVPDTGISGAVLGDPIWIVPGTNALATTSNTGANLPFGRVVETPAAGNRGVPTGKLRIDLDQKDTIV